MPIDLFEKYLPPNAQEIVALIGLLPFQSLVAWRGGTYLYIHHTINADTELAKRIGITAARILSARYGGDQVEVPQCQAAIIAIRNEEIKRRRESESENSVALDFGLSGRHIRRINADDGIDDKQDDLFEDVI